MAQDARDAGAVLDTVTVPSQRTRPPGSVEETPVDRDAMFGALFEAYFVRLCALANHLLADPAGSEDVVMDAFVGLYRRWGVVRDTDNPYAYLRASVVNGSYNRIRHLRVAALRLFSHAEPSPPSAEQAAIAGIEQAALLPALRELPARQRQVLVLRYYEGLTEAEIAALLGCSAGSVKTHASRGIRALGRQLGETQ